MQLTVNNLSDVVRVAEYCLPIDSIDSRSDGEDAADLAECVDEIEEWRTEIIERQKRKDFPIVLPKHCGEVEGESEEAAQALLKMVDEMEHAKIEAYIQHERDNFF